MRDEELTVTLVGGPTAVLETSGLRLLTDPTFDPPGSEYIRGSITLKKTGGPALDLGSMGRIDAVLLSHDQHADNLDHAGRAMLPRAGSVITTPSGSQRLGGHAVGLAPWHSTSLPAPSGRSLRITATPARHGPPGIEALSGEVTGFVLAYDDGPRGAVYISGDTVWFEGVAEVARRYDVGAIVLFMGAARVEDRGPEALTMTTADALETARAFPKAIMVPVHYQGWAHFTEGRDEIMEAFAAAGLSDRLRLLEPGQRMTLNAFGAGKPVRAVLAM
jgi:L-ascorbate metabolism protein UlaG (beta-lactamase superfamily)